MHNYGAETQGEGKGERGERDSWRRKMKTEEHTRHLQAQSNGRGTVSHSSCTPHPHPQDEPLKGRLCGGMGQRRPKQSHPETYRGSVTHRGNLYTRTPANTKKTQMENMLVDPPEQVTHG